MLFYITIALLVSMLIFILFIISLIFRYKGNKELDIRLTKINFILMLLEVMVVVFMIFSKG